VTTVTKRLSWALALSIGLNLFLLGYGGSRWFRTHRSMGPPGAAMHGPKHGPGLARWLGPPTPEVRGQHRALSEARTAVGQALTAEPYDAARLAHALSELRTHTSKSQEVLHQRLLELAATMTPEQRRELARSRFVRAAGPDDGPQP
jgi:uncharacterized membrane protein